MVTPRGIGRSGVASLGLAGVLAAGLGCVGPQVSAPAPGAGCAGCTEDALLTPGMPLEVDTSWAGVCEESALEELLSKPGSSAGVRSCGSRRYRVEVHCAAACQLGGDTGALRGEARGGGASIRVTPAEVGPFSFSVVMTELESGERHEYRSPVMTVRAPDAIGLLCLHEPDSLAAFVPCGERPLRADKPFFLAVGELAGRQWLLPQPVLNDRRDVPSRRLRLIRDHVGVRSLRDLFPEAASGAGVRPGEYSVSLAFGDERVVQVLRVE